MSPRAAATVNRPSSRSPGGFYGWHVAGFAAVAAVATAPGQTAGVSAFIDPMIRELGVSRSAIATAYLVGTLVGAASVPFVGRALDRFGPRRTMAVVGAVFGAVLLGLSAVSGVLGLTAGFVGIRLAGQGALGLVATTVTALWFTRRRGLAIGLVSAVGSAGVSLAPLLLERVIAAVGWRQAWAVEGVAVWLVVLPVALLGLRDHPPFFWTVVAGVAASGLLCTAVAFHQIALLQERGLSTAEAAANFLPQTAAGLVSTLAVGVAVDRVSPRWLTTGSMLTLLGALLWGTVVSPGWSALGFGVSIGAAGGSIRSVEAASFPRYFGVAHIGEIRGLVTAISVGSTAFGPLSFALVRAATGSFTAALLGGAVLPAAVALVAPFVRPPTEPA